VVVTASRHAQTVDTVLASVTVLTRAEIAASQAPDLIDLLGRQAGIDVSRTGGPGSSSTLFMRGANSNQTLILIDGIRVNATGQGLIDLAHLPPDRRGGAVGQPSGRTLGARGSAGQLRDGGRARRVRRQRRLSPVGWVFRHRPSGFRP
jgi:outer membrane receptor protein involved in Fe transport